MYCKKCGREIREGAKFCPKCGEPVPVKKTKVPVCDEEHEEKKTKLPWIVIIIALVIIVAAIVVFVTFGLPMIKGSSDTPGPVPQTQVEQDTEEETKKQTEEQTETKEETMSETVTTETEETRQTEETEAPVEADINGVKQQTVAVSGKVITDDKKWCIQLDSPQSVYALNSSGSAQRLKNVSFLYLSSSTDTNYNFKDYSGWEISAKGSVSIAEGKVFLIASEINTIAPPEVKAETVSDDEENWSNSEEDEYILPDSNSRYLKASDLAGLSKHDLMLARNEIYARRGRKFDDKELRNYFMSKSWYNPTIESEDFSVDIFNDYEKKNIDFIKTFE